MVQVKHPTCLPDLNPCVFLLPQTEKVVGWAHMFIQNSRWKCVSFSVVCDNTKDRLLCHEQILYSLTAIIYTSQRANILKSQTKNLNPLKDCQNNHSPCIKTFRMALKSPIDHHKTKYHHRNVFILDCRNLEKKRFSFDSWNSILAFENLEIHVSGSWRVKFIVVVVVSIWNNSWLLRLSA